MSGTGPWEPGYEMRSWRHRAVWALDRGTPCLPNDSGAIGQSAYHKGMLRRWQYQRWIQLIDFDFRSVRRDQFTFSPANCSGSSVRMRSVPGASGASFSMRIRSPWPDKTATCVGRIDHVEPPSQDLRIERQVIAQFSGRKPDFGADFRHRPVPSRSYRHLG